MIFGFHSTEGIGREGFGKHQITIWGAGKGFLNL